MAAIGNQKYLDNLKVFREILDSRSLKNGWGGYIEGKEVEAKYVENMAEIYTLYEAIKIAAEEKGLDIKKDKRALEKYFLTPQNDAHFTFYKKKENKTRFVEKEINGVKKKVKEKYTKERTITVSNPEIKDSLIMLERILELMLDKNLNEEFIPSCVYSYQEGKSYATCAKQHIVSGKKKNVMTFDIKNYFHCITKKMIYNVVVDLIDSFVANRNYSTYFKKNAKAKEIIAEMKEELPYLFASLCTVTAPDGSSEKPVLAMGLETSGTISNLILKESDKDINSRFSSKGVVYTRYSDNLIFSTKGKFDESDITYVKDLIENSEYYGEKKPFKLNEDKFAIKLPSQRQRILGVIINEKANVPVEKEKWIRSRLTHFHKDCCDFREKLPTLDIRKIKSEYKRLCKDMRLVQGKLSYMKAINENKFNKYNTWLYSSSMILKEIKEELENALS